MNKKFKSVIDRQYFDGKTFTKYVGNEYYWWKVTKDQGKYKRGKSVSIHRYVWEFYNGDIPEGFQIHHKDHNRANNALENLELVETTEHCRYHTKKRMKENPEAFAKFHKAGIAAAPEWHRSDVGRAWHREHAKETARTIASHGEKKECTWCGKEFIGLSSHTKKGFCSASCQGMARKKSGVDDIEKICPICNNTFKTNKYQPSKTCSKECGSISSARTRTRAKFI